MPHICHIHQFLHLQISHILHQHLYLIWTQCNQYSDQEHWYTYISHYWYMPMTKYAFHNAHTCSTAHLLYSRYRPLITAHFHQKSINCNFLPNYCKIYASIIYAPLIPYICHMPKLLDVHQWEKYANIYVTYELTAIDHVTRSAVHRWCKTKMMMPQPNCHLAKSVKTTTCISYVTMLLAYMCRHYTGLFQTKAWKSTKHPSD